MVKDIFGFQCLKMHLVLWRAKTRPFQVDTHRGIELCNSWEQGGLTLQGLDRGQEGAASRGGGGRGGGGGAVAGSSVRQEAKAVEAVDCKDDQPEVEGEAGKGSEEDPSPGVRLLCLPGEEGWDEGDKEDEGVDEEEDDEDLAELDEVVTPSPRATAHKVASQHHGRLSRGVCSDWVGGCSQG